MANDLVDFGYTVPLSGHLLVHVVRYFDNILDTEWVFSAVSFVVIEKAQNFDDFVGLSLRGKVSFEQNRPSKDVGNQHLRTPDYTAPTSVRGQLGSNILVLNKKWCEIFPISNPY